MLHIAIHIFLYNTSTVYSSEKLLALSRPQSVKVNIKKAGILVYLFFNSQHMRQAVNKKQNFNSSFMPNPGTHITEHPHFRTTWYTGEFTKTLKNGKDSSAAAIPYCTGFQSSATPVSCCHYGAAVHYTHPSAITAAHAATQVMQLRLPKKHKPTL